MRVRHWLILALALPLTGCGGCSGCGKSGDPRDAAGGEDEKKPPAELSVRLQAATALPKHGELPPELLAAFQDDSPHVRRAAVFTVRRSGADAKAISAALTPLLKDHDLFVRVVAAEALWEADKDGDALAAMKRGMRDGDARARTRAVQALGEVGPAAQDVAPELTALLKQTEPDTQVVIAQALERIRFADVPALAEAMMRAQAAAVRSGDDRPRRAMYRMFEALGKDAAPPLVRAMKSGGPERQKSAALALVALGPEARAAVPALIGLLKVRQLNTHRTAAEMLGRLGPDAEPAILNLMELLDDDDPEMARVAAVALGGIGRPALQPLLIRLRSKSAKNELATVALAKLGKDAVAPLLDALKSDDTALRRRAALALGEMESPPKEALPAVLALLREWTDDPEGDAFGAAVGAAGFRARRREAPAARRLLVAVAHFRGDGADAIPVLAPLLKDRSPAVRALTARVLAAMGPAARPAAPALREMLADPEGVAANAAAAALLALKPERKEDVPILAEVVTGVRLDEAIRGQAVEMIGRLGPDAAGAVPALLAVMGDRREENAGLPLPEVLGRIGAAALPQVVKAAEAKGAGRKRLGRSLTYLGAGGRAVLRRWLTADDPELRAVAAWELGAPGAPPEVRAALVDALTDLDADVRRAAAAGVRAAGVEATTAVPALSKRLLDPNARVRLAAARTLAGYGTAARAAVPALLDLLREDEEAVRNAARFALWRIGVGRENLPALAALLKENNATARAAILVLGSCGDEAKDTAAALRELRQNERLEEVAQVALWHVAQDARAGTFLLDRLQNTDPATRAWAAGSLGGNDPGAALVLPALCDALRDRNPLVRDAAARALGETGGAAAVPELAALVKPDAKDSLNMAPLDALVALKAAARPAVPTLKALAKDAPAEEQVSLYAAVWDIVHDEAVIDALAALLADKLACAAAAEALGEIGATAKAAVPALRKQRDNRERTLRDFAIIDEALRKIAAQ